MASLFISYSSSDQDAADRVSRRMRAEGYGVLFLDFDPEQGIPAGRSWERELYAQLRKTDAVIFLASEASVASRWCFAEVSLARSLGKPIFPLLLEGGVRMELLDDVQWLDLTDGEQAYARMWAGLRRAGLDPAEGPSRAASPAPTSRAGDLRGAVNDTVAVEDQLSFAHYVDAFARLIDSPHTDPPLTIGIYGSWGMGKSFLLSHIESKLCDEKFKNRPQPPGSEPRPDVHIVHFNAWEYSAAEVIWPGLVRKILDKLEETWSRPRRFATRFWRNARRQTRQFRGPLILAMLVLTVVFLAALWQSKSDAKIVGGVIAAIGIGGVFGVLKLTTDTLANPLGQYVTALAEDRDYGRHIGYMTDIREDLKKLEERLRRDNGLILVVIDDLDRCEPEKAVEVLQAINLLLNFESFIVCLGIDARIITAAVEKHYEGLLGEVGASGYEYLEKIVQIPFRIPQPGEEEIKTFIAKLLGEPKLPPEERETTPEPSREEEPQGEMPTSDQEVEPDKETVALPDARVAFTYHELKAFQDVAPFLRPNPRHLKRLVNVYRLVRSLAAAKDERAILDKPAATIRWLVMCSQWPYTSQVMLWQFGELLEEGNPPLGVPAEDPLLFLLDAVGPRLSREKQRKLDEDLESLHELIKRADVWLTWDELQRIRRYTVNFNPAIEGELRALPAAEGPLEPTGEGLPEMTASEAQTNDAPV